MVSGLGGSDEGRSRRVGKEKAGPGGVLGTQLAGYELLMNSEADGGKKGGS